MNLRILLIPFAFVVEAVSALFRSGRETGLGDWVCDRKPGDDAGGFFQTREEAAKAAREDEARIRRAEQ